ncbi:MAG: hypothetical protein ACJA0N_000137 [Pseudohongiellaceae bacterium]|jgi:hypothetical protein
MIAYRLITISNLGYVIPVAGYFPMKGGGLSLVNKGM